MSPVSPGEPLRYGRPGVAIPEGVVPALKGDPATAARTPVELLMVNADTLLDPPFATYRNDPLGETVTPAGLVPAEKGDPATAVKAPVVLLIVKAETLLDP